MLKCRHQNFSLGGQKFATSICSIVCNHGDLPGTPAPPGGGGGGGGGIEAICRDQQNDLA